MRKLAWLALIILIVGTVLITLGITNYAGIGDAGTSFVHNTFMLPIRNWAVGTWLFIGTNGWYILAAVVAISVFGGLFMTFIVYNLIWKRGIQQKLLHRGSTATPTYQSAPAAATIPITNLQSAPAPKATAPAQPAQVLQKEETT